MLYIFLLNIADEYNSYCLLTEIGGVSKATEACDWWSLGALLFELLTGMVSVFSLISSKAWNCFCASSRLWCSDFFHTFLTVPPATVAAPSSRNPLPHSAAYPRPPEHCSCIPAYRGQGWGTWRPPVWFHIIYLLLSKLCYSVLQLLQFDAGYRLGSGGGGVSDIKCHPFFSAISWKALSC